MKLAIFGCGKIANRIAASCKLTDNIELVGFGSKDPAKAEEYARKYGCPDFGDYDHFLNSDIDAVYIANYNAGHEALIRRCLEHHKNVICEKPMLFSEKQVNEAFDLAQENGVLLMEALKSVFLPLNLKIKKMIEDKAIGDITDVYAAFMRGGDHPADHWINDPETGGAFMDLGSYCVGTLNFLTGIRPKLIKLESDRTKETAETSAEALLDYDGIKGRVCVSNSKDGDMTLIISGTKGYIRADDFWKSGSGYYEVDGKRYEIAEELISDFYYELKHFADLVDNGIKESPVMDRMASLDILHITAKIKE
ncbi:MAG: Gfo/Idh/MocA family oxidoreductase [Erysipelotrichaceae bacterium]|nr:Gfo/Idh/MocA family oxidoreductase [Erysipelotrichaceae bacterium]